VHSSGKPGSDQVQPFARRERALIDAIMELAWSGLRVIETHAIMDPFGPSIVDSKLTALVASTETELGAQAVNGKRAEKGLNLLQLVLTARENPAIESSRFLRSIEAHSSAAGAKEQ